MSQKLKTLFGIPKIIKNYLLWFENRFGLHKKRFSIYHLRNGLDLKVLSSSFNIINHIWNLDHYKKSLIKKGALVVDIGAHVGIFTLAASYLTGPEGKVYSFEPTKENFEILQENISSNNIKNVTAINKAVSKKSGPAEIYFDNKVFGEGSHSLYALKDNIQKRKISCTTLSNFFKEYKIKNIDFMKVDCEGAEYDIFYNCPDNILKKITHISMELHKIEGQSINDFLTYLENKGFRIKKVPIYGGDFLVYADRLSMK